MPIQRCTLPGGGQGWKWGNSGKCYPDRASAAKQAVAIYASGYKEKALATAFAKAIEKGGAGSGNFGHAGRPGEQGGSGEGGHGGREGASEDKAPAGTHLTTHAPGQKEMPGHVRGEKIGSTPKTYAETQAEWRGGPKAVPAPMQVPFVARGAVPMKSPSPNRNWSAPKVETRAEWKARQPKIGGDPKAIAAFSRKPVYSEEDTPDERTGHAARFKIESSNLSKGAINMNGFRIFAQLQKVDAEKRLIYGRAVQEMIDKDNEVFDYKTSKPLFQKWSDEVTKDSGGKSLGNVRAMHGKIAAGKVTEIDFNDAHKAIDICAKIVDENEWAKVMEGVYTGFSIGGKYVGEKITEKSASGSEFKRYTAEPSEISIVDRPCIPSAKFFNVVKHDASGKEIMLTKIAFAEKNIDGRACIDEDVDIDNSGQDSSVATGVETTDKGSTEPENNVDPLKKPAAPKSIEEANDPDRKEKITDKGSRPTNAQSAPVGVAVTQHVGATDAQGQARDTSLKATKEEMVKYLQTKYPGGEASVAKMDDADIKKHYDTFKKAEEETPEYQVQGDEKDVEALAKLMNDARLNAGTVLKIVQDAVAFTKADSIREYVSPMNAEDLEKYVKDHGGAVEKVENLDEADYSADYRKQLAGAGAAMPDGSFPIATRQDVAFAIKALPRATDKKLVQEFVKGRAWAIGAYDLLPEEWIKDDAQKFDVSGIRKALKDGVIGGTYDTAGLISIVQGLHSLTQKAWYDDLKNKDKAVPDTNEDAGPGANRADTQAVPPGDKKKGPAVATENNGQKDEEDGKDVTISFSEKLIPDRLRNDVANLVETIKMFVDEETAELIDAIDPAEKVDPVSLFSRLAKVGARNSANDLGRIQKVHDIACDLGAGCGAMTDKLAAEKDALGITDKATGNAFDKAIASAVSKLVDPLKDELAKTQKQLKALEDQPAPSTVVLRAVGKGQDTGSGADARTGPVEVDPILQGSEVNKVATGIKGIHKQGGKAILSIGNERLT